MTEHRDIIQTLEMLTTLTVDEAIFIGELPRLAKEAKAAAAIVSEAFTFKMGQERLTVWKDDHNAEYLTRDGTWQMRYLHDTADVKCTEAGIFEMLQADFLVETSIVDKYSNDLMTTFEIDIQQKARIAGYFKVFLEKTKKTLEEKHQSVMREDD